MKSRTRRAGHRESIRSLPLMAGCLLFAAGCGGDSPPERADELLPVTSSTPTEDPRIPEAATLRSVPTDTVQGWTGPGGAPFEVTRRTPSEIGHLVARIGRRTFDLAARQDQRTLVQYPCRSCHEGVTAVEERTVDAHRNIQPAHPAASGGNCATCHAPDSVETLVLPGGGRAGMDHAYRLCAQCHAPQLRDWAGGTHGKRLAGWSGQRIVMNCTDCHDPHRPELAPRIPFPGPRLNPARGGSR